MKIADFRGEITPTGQISVPPEIASQVPPGEKVAVESAYAPDDSNYEQLSPAPQTASSSPSPS